MDPELDDIIENELDRLYRFAYNRVQDEYKAEDIVQDIVMTAYSAYPRLHDKTKTGSWLWGIARNIVMRSYSGKTEIPSDEIVITSAAGISYETPENEYIRKIDITNIRKAVSFMAKKYRDVCVLFYIENKDYNTIASELGIPLSSVKWRLSQTRSRLREEFTKMDYMENGYRKAIPLNINMGGWAANWDKENECYDGADKALEGLLSQNICISAYEKPLTVTEIASDLGVAAEYVEEALQKLVSTQCIKQTGDKYQTMFPIWDAEANNDIYGMNFKCADNEAKDILDAIYSLSDDIKNIGFYGSDKEFDKLMLFLISFICYNTKHNEFETEKLPFKGNDKAWFILTTTEKKFHNIEGCGTSTNGSSFGLVEFYFSQRFTRDNRSSRKEEQQTFYALYLGENITDEYSLSKLIESGKVVKSGNEYKITVPVISSERGEWGELLNVLSPVFEKTNALQEKLYTRSRETVKKYIPKHIAPQAEFFGSYCCHCVLETALFKEFVSRGANITQDMATWFAVK